MKRAFAAAILTLLVGRAIRAQESSERLRAVARAVVDLDLRRQFAQAVPATIDSLLALYSDSVVYEHPNAGAIVRGKETMRRGMAQYIGTVRLVHADPPRVTTGPGVAVVETQARVELRDHDTWIPVTRHGIRVIEFDAKGLVRRVIDYPW
jgi:hypothetical protein